MQEHAATTGWRETLQTRLRTQRYGPLVSRLTPAIAIVYTATVGSLFIALSPMFWGGYSTYLHLSDGRIGDLMSGEFLGSMMATVAGLFYMHRPGLDLRRVLYAALAVYVIGNAMTPPLFASPQGLMGVRVICGLSAGTSFMAAATAITGLGSPPRLVALFYGAPFITGAVLQPLVQPLFLRWGLSSAFEFIAVATAASVAMYRFCPRFAASTGETSGGTRAQSRGTLWVGILSLSLLLQFIANAGIWLYFDRIGELSGHAVQTVANIVGIGTGMSLIGTWLSALLATRLPPVPAILLGTGVIAVSSVALHDAASLPVFAVSVALFNAMITFLTPFYFILLVKIYAPARAVVIGNICMALGFSAGPQLIRYTVLDSNFARSINVTVGLFATSAALVILFWCLNHSRES